MSYNQDSPNSPETPEQQDSDRQASLLDFVVAAFTIISVILQGASLVFQIKEYFMEESQPEAVQVVQTENQPSQCQSESGTSGQ